MHMKQSNFESAGAQWQTQPQVSKQPDKVSLRILQIVLSHISSPSDCTCPKGALKFSFFNGSFSKAFQPSGRGLGGQHGQGLCCPVCVKPALKMYNT